MILSCHKSDSLENLHSKSFPCNCSNDVDSVPFLSDEVSPNKQNISAFVNIVVLSNSAAESGKCFLEVGVELLFHGLLLRDFLRKLLCLSCMCSFFCFALLLELSSSLLLTIQLGAKLCLPKLEGSFCPSPECSPS